MKCYIISYDLRFGGDYSSLHNALKSYGTWAKITESTWAVVTSQTAIQIANYLLGYMDKNDRIFIVNSGGEAAFRGILCTTEWLQKNIPNNSN